MSSFRRRAFGTTRVAAWFAFVALLLFVVGAAAQTAETAPPGPAPASSAAPAGGSPSDAPSPEALAEAKELFKSGVTLFNAGDMERALDYFLRSRAAYASSKNTINAAICLDKLGRYDEALELYEEVLTKFAASLDDESRAAIAPAMTALRGKVGSITVSANVDGSVLVDGRSRGKLPLTGPVRVLGGKHVVRVLKDGYAAAEATVTVEVGQTATADLRLKPLAAAGLLRVEDSANPGAEVFVDRVAVGTAPWEGTLGPGKHLVWVVKGDLGTAPTEANVVQGQTVLVRVKSVPLGVSVRLEPAPGTAQIVLGTVPLGAGTWEGRLPVGSHTVVVQEPGYFPKTIHVSVPPPGGNPIKERIQLSIDRNHPRWPKPGAAGKLWVGGFGGYGWSPSLKGGASDVCPSDCRGTNERARGFLLGARVGYRFPLGLSIELTGGYLQLVAGFSRIMDSTYGGGVPIRYYVDDEIGFSGPLALVGASYRFAVGGSISLTGRAAGGVVFARSIDVLGATARTLRTEELVKMEVVNAGDAERSVAIVVSPEVAAGYSFGPFEVGVAVSALAVINDGPNLNNGNLQVPPALAAACVPGFPSDDVKCAQTSSVVKNERAYGGGMFVLSPQLTATYTF